MKSRSIRGPYRTCVVRDRSVGSSVWFGLFGLCSERSGAAALRSSPRARAGDACESAVREGRDGEETPPLLRRARPWTVLSGPRGETTTHARLPRAAPLERRAREGASRRREMLGMGRAGLPPLSPLCSGGAAPTGRRAGNNSGPTLRETPTSDRRRRLTAVVAYLHRSIVRCSRSSSLRHRPRLAPPPSTTTAYAPQPTPVPSCEVVPDDDAIHPTEVRDDAG